MTPRRILLTGAGGFVGRHLLPLLRERFPAAEIMPTASRAADGRVTLDVTDRAAVAALVRSVRPDACVHLAGMTQVPAATADPDRAWAVNLHGTLAVARAILAHAPDCRFVFASSAEVYGRSFRAGLPLDEGAVLAPANTYAATKAAADLAVGALVGQGLRAVRVRAFNHTGPGQSAAFVVAAFARQVARIAAGLQPPVLRVGALDPARDFLDARDVCAAYAACLAADDLEPGVILNLAFGVPRRIGDVLAGLRAIAGIEAAVETSAGLLRPSEIPIAIGDSARARAVLGWAPAIDWEVTLRDTLDDWRGRVAADPNA